jgi:hypothetical protein
VQDNQKGRTPLPILPVGEALSQGTQADGKKAVSITSRLFACFRFLI